MQKPHTVNVSPSYKTMKREVISEKTISLERIVERRVKKKKGRKKEKRAATGEMSQWNSEPQRTPIIQRFRFTPETVSPDRTEYNWEN